jgi:hypothetical protein
MQDQIYKILSSRSGKPLRQIIRDTKRTDFYLDAQNALDYGLIEFGILTFPPDQSLIEFGDLIITLSTNLS